MATTHGQGGRSEAAPERIAERIAGRIAGLGALACIVGTLLGRVGGFAPGFLLADGGFALLALAVIPRMPRAARLYLAVVVVLCVLSLGLHGEMPPSLPKGLTAGAFLASILLAVGILGSVASRSGLILRCGESLVRQAPGRRYTALTLGGHAMAILLNLGTLTLLGTMIERALEQEKDNRIRAIRQRRMTLALMRAFCVVVLWSPMSIGIAFVLSIMPQVHWGDVGPYGIVFMVFLLGMGWALDRASYPPPPPSDQPTPVPWADVAGLASVILAVFLGASLVQAISGTSLIGGIILAAPLVALGWRAGQEQGPWTDKVGAALGHGCSFVTSGIGRMAPELSIMGLAAVLGGVAADFIPTEGLQTLMQSLSLPLWALVGGVCMTIIVLGQIGLNPVISIPLLLPSLQTLIPSQAAPLLALACLGGWTLCLGSSPFVSTSLLIARHTPVSSRVIGHRWNGVYTLLGVAMMVGYLAVLQMIQGIGF
jgi:hypothetical protein